MINSKVRSGRWQRIHRGVYATFSGEPGREAMLWAAQLSAGPGAMLSYRTAAELGRLTDSPSSVIHVTVPVERRVARVAGIVVHYSARLLTEDAAGLHSILERRYDRDVERPHGLPAGSRQAHVRHDDRSEYRDRLYDAYGSRSNWTDS
jgi:hypothetical protein